MASIRRNLGIFDGLWRGQSSDNLRDVEAKGLRLVEALKEHMDKLYTLKEIPSSLRGFPILTVFAFLGWGCLIRGNPEAEFDQREFTVLREFLAMILEDLTGVLEWTDGRQWDTAQFVDDSIAVLPCFEDALPFRAVFGSVGKCVPEGFQQGISSGDSFSRPDEDNCYYHNFKPEWIHSVNRLMNPPPPELLAVLEDYMVIQELRSHDYDEGAPEAYRACVIDGIPMIRCVRL